MVSGSLLATLLCFEMPFLAAIFNLGKIGGPVGADSDDVNRRTSAGIIRQPRPVSAPRRGVRVWVDRHRERDQEKLPQEHARFSTPPHRPRLRVRLRAGYRPPLSRGSQIGKNRPLEPGGPRRTVWSIILAPSRCRSDTTQRPEAFDHRTHRSRARSAGLAAPASRPLSGN